MAKISRVAGASAAGEVSPGGAAQGEGAVEVVQPAEVADSTAPEPDLGEVTRPEGSRRPPVNAKKGEHAQYAADTYGLDATVLEAEHTKESLLSLLDDLEAGRLVARDGAVVAPEDDGDPETPDPADEASTGAESDPDGDDTRPGEDAEPDAPGDGPDPNHT